MFNRWCRRGERPTLHHPCVFAPGGTPGGGLFPFTNSARPFTEPFSGTTPVSPAPPLIPACFDTLTPLGFSVSYSATTTVSGGGSALALALASAPTGTRLLITDSLDYSPIAFTNKTNITIEADASQTPTITAVSGNGQHCVTFNTTNNGIALLGLTFIGSGNATAPATPGQASHGLITYNNGAGGLRNLIIQDCDFIEPALTVQSGAPGIWLRGTTGGVTQQNISVNRCTFTNVGASASSADASGYGAVTIGGFSRVFVQNCLITRDSAVLTRNLSPMRGVVIRCSAGFVEDVFCKDIGTGGACENFLVPTGAAFGTTTGPVTLRNCVSLNGRMGYAVEVASSPMIVENSVYYATELGITVEAVHLNTIGALNYTDSISFGAGDGFAFTPDPQGSPIVEDHNDIFNFTSNGRTLDPSDIQIDPLFQGYVNGDFVATAPAARTAGTGGAPVGVVYPGGEKIIWCEN